MLCLVGFKDAESVDPLNLDHQNDMNGRLIIEKIEDMFVNRSIPYR
jgi:hypothetical protein